MTRSQASASEAREAGRRKVAHAALGVHLQVVAGAECLVARSGDDADPLLVVGGKFIPDLVQLLVGLEVGGVHHVGSVDRDDGEVAVSLDGAEFSRFDVTHGLFVARVKG